jgi:hypothetical protein
MQKMIGAILPLDPRVKACREANIAQARQLLRAERDYWEGYMAKATTHGDREYAMDHLDRLRVLEKAS